MYVSNCTFDGAQDVRPEEVRDYVHIPPTSYGMLVCFPCVDSRLLSELPCRSNTLPAVMTPTPALDSQGVDLPSDDIMLQLSIAASLAIDEGRGRQSTRMYEDDIFRSSATSSASGKSGKPSPSLSPARCYDRIKDDDVSRLSSRRESASFAEHPLLVSSTFDAPHCPFTLEKSITCMTDQTFTATHDDADHAGVAVAPSTGTNTRACTPDSSNNEVTLAREVEPTATEVVASPTGTSVSNHSSLSTGSTASLGEAPEAQRGRVNGQAMFDESEEGIIVARRQDLPFQQEEEQLTSGDEEATLYLPICLSADTLHRTISAEDGGSITTDQEYEDVQPCIRELPYGNTGNLRPARPAEEPSQKTGKPSFFKKQELSIPRAAPTTPTLYSTQRKAVAVQEGSDHREDCNQVVSGSRGEDWGRSTTIEPKSGTYSTRETYWIAPTNKTTRTVVGTNVVNEPRLLSPAFAAGTPNPSDELGVKVTTTTALDEQEFEGDRLLDMDFGMSCCTSGLWPATCLQLKRLGRGLGKLLRSAKRRTLPPCGANALKPVY